MAKIVITDTEKTGWIKIEFNDYYPDTYQHKIQHERKSDFVAVDYIKFSNEECIELMSNSNESLMLTNDAYSDVHLCVDSVNGTAPIDLEHLRELLQDLL